MSDWSAAEFRNRAEFGDQQLQQELERARADARRLEDLSRRRNAVNQRIAEVLSDVEKEEAPTLAEERELLQRRAIAETFRSWEMLPNPAVSKFRFVGVSDTANNRYTLLHVDHEGDRYDASLLAHLEIRAGKIWILTDNTEEGVATDLLRFGIPEARSC